VIPIFVFVILSTVFKNPVDLEQFTASCMLNIDAPETYNTVFLIVVSWRTLVSAVMNLRVP